jgi:hypothetical protein
MRFKISWRMNCAAIVEGQHEFSPRLTFKAPHIFAR